MRRIRTACCAAVLTLATMCANVGRVEAAPNGCSTGSPAYGVGISITPEFVGTDVLAIAAYQGEIVDYDVTVFLRIDPLGVTVCPIFNGTVTVTLPDGSGPFVIATGVSLDIGQSVTFADVPASKYTVDEADATAGSQIRVDASASVAATSDGPDDGPQDDAPVTATAVAPTFLMRPSTSLSIEADRTVVHVGDAVVWTIVERNDTPAGYFPAPLQDVRVELSTDGGTTSFGTLTAASSGFSGDNGDGTLGVGEAWTWTVTTNPTADTVVTATGFGTGPRSRVFTYPGDPDERMSAVVDANSPSTIVGITASASSVIAGEAVIWTVTERNDGDAPLTSPSVRLDADGGDDGDIAVLSGPPASGDTDGDGVLDPSEMWTWTFTSNPSSGLTVTATGHGTDPLGMDITYPGDADERATATVQVTAPPTTTTTTIAAPTTTAATTTTLTVDVGATLPPTGGSSSARRAAGTGAVLLVCGGALILVARRSLRQPS